MNLIHQGNITCLTGASAIHAKLPVKTYDVQIDGRTGEYQLHHRPQFDMPEKIYGDNDSFAARCITTFHHLSKGMAVLLSGPKGCGKTLTAKRIALDSNMPVLCISNAFAGMGFTSFLTELPTKCVIFIDEFEKTYNDKDLRNSFLTLLDGASDNKHLFVLTSNSAQIGEYFTNRPGRVRYHKKYTELSISVLKDIIDDKMPKGPLRKAVHAMVEETGSISPDALISVIQECLIHNEPPDSFKSFFNICTELSGAYDVKIKTTGFRPKPKLTKMKLEQAKAFIQNVHEDGVYYARAYYGEGEKHCDEVDEMWMAKHCRPFEDKEMKNGIAANIWFAESGTSTKSRRFQFGSHEVNGVKREEGVIIVELKNGATYFFEKAQPLSYNYSKSE